MTRQTPLLSRLGRRLAAREASINEKLEANEPVHTDEDTQNFSDFEALVRQATHLLHEDTAAIKEGDISRVSELYPQKKAILDSLEDRVPAMEPFLSTLLEEREGLRPLLDDLQRASAENAALLLRISAATQTITQELARIRDRHGLSGLYEKSGRKIGASPAPQPRIDESM